MHLSVLFFLSPVAPRRKVSRHLCQDLAEVSFLRDSQKVPNPDSSLRQPWCLCPSVRRQPAAVATLLPSCLPAPALGLLIFTISKQTHRRYRCCHRGVFTCFQHLKRQALPECLGFTISHLRRGKSRDKSRSGCFL